MSETITLSEYFHFVEYGAHIKGTKNEVDCPLICAGEYIPLEDWDRVIDRWGGPDERQEIYLVGSDDPSTPDYIITQRLTIEEPGDGEYLVEF